MRFPAFQVEDNEMRPAHLAHEQHELVSEQRCVGDETPVALGDEIAPVCLLRRIARRDNDLEVGRVRVGADKETIAVIHHIVVQPRAARRDEPGRSGRMIEIHDQGFRSVVAMHGDYRRATETRRLNADEPGRVGFHEDLDIVSLRGPQTMQHHSARAVALILLDIKKGLGIPRPDDVPCRPDDIVGKVRLALKITDRNCQHLGAEVVRAPGEF